MTERAFTTGDVNTAIAEYRRQQNELVQQLRQVDEQRAQIIKTLDLLQGAVIALEALLQTPLPVQEPGAPEGTQATADYPEGGC